ncbi:MAG: hypothetical protein K2X35_04390 [Bryobacteraceae bacterium]|nr:hypothetical protein [Bryobacteraceae bacterium]
MVSLGRFVAAVLVLQLSPAPLLAQARSQALRIRVLAGEGSVNNVSTRGFTIPVIEVRDDNDLPVEGADVVFEVPAEGPGGKFAGGQSSYKTRTNVQGQAAATGFEPGTQTGSFRFRVTARMGDRTAIAAINQVNSADTFVPEPETKKSRAWLKWVIIGGLAGGAAIGAVLATRGGGDSSGSPRPVLVPGTVGVGGPR